MTSTQALQIGKRLLGTYLLVQGLILSAGTLGVFGYELPPGGSRIGLVAATALQGLIAVVAGIVLVRARIEYVPPVEFSVEPFKFVHPTVQLLGVYFLVEGLWALTRPAVAILFYSTAWQTRISDFVAALVAVFAGLILIARPARIADALQNLRRD
jgi:hypothetical protein